MTTPVSAQLCTPWAALDDLPPVEDRPDLTDEQWTDLLLAASEIMWALSGRRWSGDGGCEATAVLRFERGRCCGWSGSMAAHHYGWSSGFGGLAMKLPHDEVTEVVSVTIGATPFLRWRYEGAWLYRTDGRGWGECLTGDVTITYLWGLAPPIGGKLAVLAYVLELGRAIVGDDECRLPQRVISIVRQGVSMTLIDPQRYLSEGRLGIPELDQWLASVNPSGLPERGMVWSPDLPHARLV